MVPVSQTLTRGRGIFGHPNSAVRGGFAPAREMVIATFIGESPGCSPLCASSLTTSINDSPITSAPDMVLSCLSASTSLTRGMSRRVLRGASQSCYRRCIRTVTVGPLNLTRCMPPEVPRTRNRASAQARGVAAVFCCPSGNGLPSCWLRIVNACFRAMYRLRPWCGRFAFPPAISR